MRVRVVVLGCLILAAVLALEPARAACDTTPPDLIDFSFSPTAINTTAGGQTVLCTMTVTDDLSGTALASCTFLSPTFAESASCSATVPTSGSPANGTFSCLLSFPRYSEPGTWQAQVTIEDVVGNSQTVFPEFIPLPFEIAVTSTPDTAPPALTSFVVNPTSVDVSAANRNVTCTMTVTDALAGVNVAFCSFESPDANQAQGCAANAPSSGTPNSGVYTCTFAMPRYSDAGNWTPSVFLIDRVGNFLSAPVAPYSVVSNPEDVAGPGLSAFSFTPTAVSTGDGAKAVACTFDVTDNLSGVAAADCTFTYTDPFNPFLTLSQQCTATAPASGTRTLGTFQCSAVIPRYSTGGTWDVDGQLIDRVGNITDFAPAEVLDVDCSTGDIETTCRFTSKTTLTWDALLDAERYNVYRGDLSGMIDLAPVDQLPDGGYGTCQNSRDANLTDTTFVDADIPSAIQIGFHYLVSYTSGDVELGLGYQSSGSARTVASPCP